MLGAGKAKRLWRKLRPKRLVTPAVVSIRCREIMPADLEGVTKLLLRGFGWSSRDHWAMVIKRLTEHQTPAGFPEYGYMLENDGIPVGVVLLIFTQRVVKGVPEIWCCGSSYYVDPVFRPYAYLLLKRAHRFKNVTYLDVAPSSHRWPALAAQGYKQIAQGVYAAIPALCRATPGVQVREVTDVCDERLELYERDLLITHANYGRCVALVCEQQGTVRPFVFALRHRHRVPFAHLIFTRDQADFVLFAGAIGRYFMRRGIPVVVLDADGPIRGVPGRHMKLYLKFWNGAERPCLGDLAYTEIPMFGVI